MDNVSAGLTAAGSLTAGPLKFHECGVLGQDRTCGRVDSGMPLSILINRFERTTGTFSIATEIFSADIVLIHARSSKDVFHCGHHHRWTGGQ